MIESSYYNTGVIKSEKHYRGKLLHNDDGPAITFYYEDGQIKSVQYLINGQYHREDGPAYIEYTKNGVIKHEEYYLNGCFKSFKNANIVRLSSKFIYNNKERIKQECGDDVLTKLVLNDGRLHTISDQNRKKLINMVKETPRQKTNLELKLEELFA